MRAEDIIQSASAWSGQSLEHVRAAWGALPPGEQNSIATSLGFRYDARERLARRLGSDALNRLPYGLYRPLTTALKRLRRPAHPATVPQPGPYAEFLASLGPPRPLIVCLSHDIDTAACAQRWAPMLELEASYGLRSTSNVLTEGPYRLDHGWLDELEARGFEIGLHGDTHDMAIGFRGMAHVADRLQRCLEALRRPVAGYRAPALAVSPALLELLPRLGFRYDSSIPAQPLYAQGVAAQVPFRVGPLWEIPLAAQDDALLRAQPLPPQQAAERVLAMIDAQRLSGGVFVLNTHPIYFGEAADFYRAVLDGLEGTRVQRLGDVVADLAA